MITRFLLLWCFLGAWAAWAEDAKAKAAREELEKQLAQMVEHEPSRVRVAFVGLDDLNYRLEEATFELDGKPLKSPPLEVLADEGEHLVWTGDAAPGRHKLTVRLVVANGASVVLSDEGGFKWKIGGDVGFELHSGIEVGLQVKPLRDATQRDVAKRFKLSLPATPVMIAKLDDGKMPEPIAAKPAVVAAATGPTSPAVVTAPSPTEVPPPLTPAEKRRLAAEERKQKAEEARQAKLAAAEEKRRKLEEAKQAKLALAEERRVAAAQAAEAKRRQEQGLPAEKPSEAVATPEVAPAPVAVPEPVAAEVLDAGLPSAPVAAVSPSPQGDSGDASVADLTEDEGPPWGLIAAAGGIAAVLFLVVVARRNARPPTI